MAAAVLLISLLLVEEQAYHMHLLMAVESIHPSSTTSNPRSNILLVKDHTTCGLSIGRSLLPSRSRRRIRRLKSSNNSGTVTLRLKLTVKGKQSKVHQY